MIRSRILSFVVAFAVGVLVDFFVGFVASDVVAVAVGTVTVTVVYVALQNWQEAKQFVGCVAEDVMEFDSAKPELHSIACEVFDRIPEDAQRRIESTCERVTFIVNGDYEAEFFDAERVIRVVVPRINDFSEQGKRGIFAHEFGHSDVYAQWGLPPGEASEKLANMCAQSWGFLREIDAMKDDRDRLRGTGDTMI